MIWIGVALGAVALFFVWQIVSLGLALARGDEATNGLGYFGRSPAEREAYREEVREQARRLSPILGVVGRLASFRFESASIEGGGVPAPKGTCTEETFAAARAYEPGPDDVFVVTQMKCGTTWMQHVVYETLMRGAGDLVDSGTALYAVSPWLESRKAVPLDDAPRVGKERPSRIIKTHLPSSACPLDDCAKYIYVTRHPAACFASTARFLAEGAGRLTPSIERIEEWFCSEDMWWGPWPDHVAGWWKASEERTNVLFVHFEDMKADLSRVVDRVAAFLEIEPLSDGERAEVVGKCSFEYMRDNAGTFAMHPPNIISTDAEMFVKGTADRHLDVPEAARDRIGAWCVKRLAGSSYPLSERYPDVTGR